MVMWGMWGFFEHIEVAKYGAAAISTRWDIFGYWGMEVDLICAYAWLVLLCAFSAQNR